MTKTNRVPIAPSDRALRSQAITAEVIPVERGEQHVDSLAMEELLQKINSAISGPKPSGIGMPTFKGSLDECVEEFMTFYEYLAKVNSWSEDQKIQHLCTALEGDARTWFRLQLPMADKFTWADWKTKMRSTFRTDNFTEMAHLKLTQRTQSVDETPEHFYYDIIQLCARVNPIMSDGEKLRHLLRAVRPELLGPIMMMSPTTPAAFLANLQQLARTKMMMEGSTFSNGTTTPHPSYQLLGASMMSPSIPISTTGQPPSKESLLLEIVEALRGPPPQATVRTPPEPIRSDPGDNATIIAELKRIGDAVEKGNYSRRPPPQRVQEPPEYRPRFPPLTTRTSDGRLRCFSCGQTGHFRQECPHPREPPLRPRNNGPPASTARHATSHNSGNWQRRA